MNIPEDLDRIIKLAEDAKAALADEHEGAFTAAINQLNIVIGDVHNVVKNW